MTATTAHLDAIEARSNAATEGPWEAWDRGIGYEVHGQHGEPINWSHGETFGKLDAEFIAHARTDVPHLLALARKQHAALESVGKVADFFDGLGSDASYHGTEAEMEAWLAAANAIRAALGDSL